VLYDLGIVLLVAVLVHGKVVRESRHWFDLGAFHLQPSELMKVMTIIALAKYIHDTPSLDGRPPECHSFESVRQRDAGRTCTRILRTLAGSG
jgi:rod shape determining protein RodA